MRLFIPMIIGCVLLLPRAADFHLQNEKLSARSSNLDSALVGQKEGMLQVGEELEYSVHYSFFNIGMIHFRVANKEEHQGKVMYHAFAIMDSNPSLSWLVDLHIRFYTDMDQNAITYKWLSEDSSSKIITYRKMNFAYEENKMYYEWGEKLRTGEYKESGERIINIAHPCEDGLALFYFAREHALEKKQAKIPTFIDTNEVSTNINFGIEQQEEDIDPVHYSIDVVKLDGHADFVGVFGLTGGFEGVFSNDAASIPITARLKVILGSVKVELKNWKRDSWIPPKAVNDK